MRPGQLGAGDVTLHQFVPREVWVGGAPVAEHAQVHQETHTGILRGVHQRLGLVVHRRGVAGHHEQPVDALERGGEGVGVVEIDTDRFLFLLDPLLDGGLAA